MEENVEYILYKKKKFDNNGIADVLNRVRLYDISTYNHSLRVAELTKSLLEKVGVYERTEEIIAGAMLHDVGKIYMPKKILNKKSALNERECEIMQKHPVDGLKILNSMFFLATIPREVVHIVCWHHLSFSGKNGYPRNEVHGEDIPYYVRLVTLVDAFDAITSDRPYSIAHDRDKAIEIMKEMDKLDQKMLLDIEKSLNVISCV